ncbi:hypothetical protein [Sphingobium lactosutens]|uniref:Uncharacterized protein n=1 Tax=Sphingobium lactosutens DS20 TaxID=1331060 RepID=T0HXY4_9SPHN|nr:hypothetical protein [Sphingobium lactosutens]EQB16943.1 hypothetical protein RLDS_05775 [Sphingobium lactosutens DS20]
MRDIFQAIAEAIADMRERVVTEGWAGRTDLPNPAPDYHFDPGNPAPPPEPLDAMRALFGTAEPARDAPGMEKPGHEQGDDFER